jgi:hypothetical protein
MNRWEAENAKSELVEWHINKALYDKFGGRVGLDKPGYRPMQAQLSLLETLEKEGIFRISSSS